MMQILSLRESVLIPGRVCVPLSKLSSVKERLEMSDDEDLAMEALLDDSDSSSAAADDEVAASGHPQDELPQVKPRKKVPDAQKKELAKELWDRLAKSRPGPDNKDLMFLARFVPLLSSAAAKTLLGKKLSLDELKELIQHVPKAKDAAVKQALKLGGDQLTEDDVRFIFTQSKSAEVGKFLIKKYPNDANLGLVERTIDDLADFIKEVRNRESTKAILREIDRKL